MSSRPLRIKKIFSLCFWVIALFSTILFTNACKKGGNSIEPEIIAVQAPIISTFTATPSEITSEKDVTLGFSVSGADTLFIDQGVGNVTGMTGINVHVAATTTYTLTATNARGSVTATAAVILIPQAVTESPDSFYFGWNVHLAGYYNRGFLTPVFQKIQDLGANSLRCGLEWGWMQYNNTTSFSLGADLKAETDIVNANTASDNPMAYIDLVGFENSLFWNQITQDITVNPASPGSVFDVYATGYANYVQHEISLRPRQTFYEIYNEWNLGFHINNATLSHDAVRDGDTYARLVTRIAPVIRSQTPDALILTAGLADCKGSGLPYGACFPWLIDQLNYLAGFKGDISLIDGVAIHTYADMNILAMPERLYSSLVTGRSWLMERSPAYAASPKDFYITEAGFPLITAGGQTFTEQDQANNLERLFFLFRTLPYVKGIWIYDFIDDAISGREGSFGILKGDQSEKAAYARLKALAPLIKKGTSWALIHGDIKVTPWTNRLTDQWINYYPKQFFAVECLHADAVKQKNQKITILWSPTGQSINVTVTSPKPMTITSDFSSDPVVLSSGSTVQASPRPLFIFQDKENSLTLN
jgi:hypothetical protein